MKIKKAIMKLFYDEGLNVNQVAKKLDISKQAVSKHLIKDNNVKYQSEKKERKKTEWKKLSVEFFYDEGLMIKEVAERVSKSSAAVSKYLSNNNPKRYKNEKARRKEESAEREKIRKKNWKKENCDRKDDTDYVILKRQHDLDVNVMSKRRSLGAAKLFTSGYLQSAYIQEGNKYLRNNHVSGALVPTSLPKSL